MSTGRIIGWVAVAAGDAYCVEDAHGPSAVRRQYPEPDQRFLIVEPVYDTSGLDDLRCLVCGRQLIDVHNHADAPRR